MSNHEGGGSGPGVDIVLSEVNGAGVAAQALGGDIGALAKQLTGDSAPAVAQGGLSIGPTLGSILPLWETHLANVSSFVTGVGTALCASSGGYSDASYIESQGARHLGTLI